MIAKQRQHWRFITACPPREVFAVMEQMIGTFPFRYEVTGENSARVVEFTRKGLFGNWTKRMLRPVQWVTCTAETVDGGTLVTVECSRRSVAGGRDPSPTRALQLVQLLSRGVDDQRTIYRDRTIPPGPVTLVASWAGTPYQLYNEPNFAAERGAEIFTASRVHAVAGGTATFVKVRCADGTEGYIERDQLVPAPERALRSAQEETARLA